MTTSSSPTTINHHHHISFFRAGGNEVLRAWAWSPQGPHLLKGRGGEGGLDTSSMSSLRAAEWNLQLKGRGMVTLSSSRLI